MSERENAARAVRLAVSGLGIYVMYGLYGVFQENITSTDFPTADGGSERFKSTFFMLFVQCLFNAACAAALLRAFGEAAGAVSAAVRLRREKSPPTLLFAVTAFAYIAAMLCSNLSLQYVDYPTQVLGKSCKPVALLVVGVLFLRRFPLNTYFTVGLITLGICVFNLERVKSRTTAHLDESALQIGRLFIAGSLLSDGITGELQTRLVSRYEPSAYRMMLNNNMWAAVYLGICLLFSSEFIDGASFVLRHPSILGQLIAFSTTSALGQVFIFYTVRNHGSLACTIITTTRKFFSILLSVFLHGHQLSSRQWLAVVVVFIGLLLHSAFGYMRKRAASGNKPVELNAANVAAGAGGAGAGAGGSGGAGGTAAAAVTDAAKRH